MSEDWKNDRAEAAMREGTEAIRKAAEEKAEQEESLKWNEVKNVLSTANANQKEAIEIVVDLLKEFYHLPAKKDN
jgi:hypothetical protein